MVKGWLRVAGDYWFMNLDRFRLSLFHTHSALLQTTLKETNKLEKIYRRKGSTCLASGNIITKRMRIYISNNIDIYPYTSQILAWFVP